MDNLILIISIIIIVLIIIILSKYNKIIRLKNRVKNSESGIDIYLKERFDLIPNLVECVKGYTKHEKELLENIVKQRTNYFTHKNLKEASKINNNLNKIMALSENYPDLKSSEQFLNLQYNLIKIESKLQAARRIYNMDVERYNSTIQTIPNNIIANMFGFKSEEFFQIEDSESKNITINGDNL